MLLPPLLILVLGGYAWGLGGKLSVTYNPVSSISLEDIPPPYCNMAAPNSSHNFMMYFFAVVDEIGGMVNEGELSWEGLMEELGRNLDPHVRQSLVQLGDHPKFTKFIIIFVINIGFVRNYHLDILLSYRHLPY